MKVYYDKDADLNLIKGKKVSELHLKEKSLEKYQISIPPRGNSMKRELIDSSCFKISLQRGTYNIIEIIPKQIITNPNPKSSKDSRSFLEIDDGLESIPSEANFSIPKKSTRLQINRKQKNRLIEQAPARSANVFWMR